ncbi:helix-turn-helix domain-containing protein [Nonomuraea guangzhouensis]|uniref:Helix-turn-helix domain-containing protein n=1 Tax=Nonomuraea guangzhouensis TaxID=1291555 RepID=A0ABW4GC83_9ACTN|nr:helix-turn-helix transcriptional regulator [Nonomuraea guangzhouensis]
MMANPTLRQRQLAKRLREMRAEAGLSIAEVAEQLLCSPAKVSRIETAQRRASLRDVRDLCRLYEVADPTELMTLAREAQQLSWWQDSEDVGFRPLIGLETEAVEIAEYETTTIPGLLQTEDYARAVIQGFLPRIAADVLDERVAVRMKRQETLHKPSPPRYWVLLDESALHRHVGGWPIMAAQLTQLAELSQLPHVTVQVVPYSIGAHMGFDSAFMLLRFAPSAGVANTVYFDTLAGQIFLEKPSQLDRFEEVLNHLRAAALDPGDSRKRILEQRDVFAAHKG